MSQLERDLRWDINSGKRILDVKDAWIDIYRNNKVLVGIMVNHPMDSYRGKVCTTNSIKSIKGNVVETNQHLYNVLSWDEKKTHPQLELF